MPQKMRTAIHEREAEGTEDHVLDLRSNPGVLLEDSTEQVGTNKDSQYRAEETTMLKALRSTERGQAYQPGSANLQSALQR